MKKKIFLLLTLVSMVSMVGCDNSTSSLTSSVESSSTQTSSVPPTSVTVPAPSSTALPISSVTPSSTPKPIEYETVIKEYYPGKYENQRFAKTTVDVTLDDMVMLAGTSNDAGSGKTLTLPDGETIKDGSSTLISGGRFKLEGKADKTGGIPTKKAIKLSIDGEGKLLIAATSANNSATDRTLTLSDAEGNELITTEPTSGDIKYFSFDLPSKGDYYLYSNINGCNIYYLKLTATVEKGVETGFSINHSNCRDIFLAGEELDTSGLVVTANFSNGNTAVLNKSDYTVTSDYSQTAGTYSVTVSYKDYEPQTYQVSSYEIESLLIETKGSVVYNNDVKLVYHVGSTLDLGNLVVKAILNDTDKTELIIGPSTYTLDTKSVDMNRAGTYNVSVSYGDAAPISLPITVAGDITKVNEQDTISINSALGNGVVNEGILNFTSLSGAMQYLHSMNSNGNVTILMSEGTYNDRVEIDLPSIHIEGQGKVVISYDAASGLNDIRGTAYGTQGSATVSIDSKAIGFVAKNIEFANTFDYANSTIGDKQAVALVNEADQSLFEDCVFTSFQDTLYAKVGRQYYKNCTIEGAIDFIFGNNAPALFEGCTIISLNRNDPDNGGYITATKGTNTGNDVPTYGYVFKSCNFTAEEGVTEQSVSLGRPWGKDATVAVIDSTLGTHISKYAYNDSSTQKNSRYEAMSGNSPVDAHYAEYGNSGEGAILEAVTGMNILTVEQYNTYTLENIFGTTNGALTFSTPWTI